MHKNKDSMPMKENEVNRGTEVMIETVLIKVENTEDFHMENVEDSLIYTQNAERNSSQDNTVIKQEYQINFKNENMQETECNGNVSDNSTDDKTDSEPTDVHSRRKIDMNNKDTCSSVQKSYKCNQCHKEYQRQWLLERHIRDHDEVKTHECSICHKTFSTASHLIRHNRIHTGEKPFTCEVCQKTFNQSSSLLRHQQVHANERLFQCSKCDKTFASTANLNEHQIVHTEVRPFHCHKCDFQCINPIELKFHIQEHKEANSKSYVCKYCDKKYSRSGSLRVHKLKEHQVTE